MIALGTYLAVLKVIKILPDLSTKALNSSCQSPFPEIPMKNCSIPTSTLNWRYRLADSTTATTSIIDLPAKSSVVVMNWRYRQTDLNYKILTKKKSISVVNWRYRILDTSAADLN
jgi:hypothetical protein